MSKNFSLKELIASDTAKSKGIDNTPSFEEVKHLNKLCDTILQPLRDAWGSAINVTSGYRCSELNRAVGGASTSAHLRGYAADMQIPKMKDFDKFVAFTVDFLKGRNFDQLLIETSGKTRWLHIGLYSSSNLQRRIIKNIVL